MSRRDDKSTTPQQGVDKECNKHVAIETTKCIRLTSVPPKHTTTITHLVFFFDFNDYARVIGSRFQ